VRPGAPTFEKKTLERVAKTSEEMESCSQPTGSTQEVRVFAVLADVSMNPDPTALPGGDVLQQLTNGIGSWALIAALIGMIVGAAAWALGHYSQNYQQSYNGRKGLLASGVAALVIGAAPSVVNFFMSLGQSVKK
jgi:MFS family permease